LSLKQLCDVAYVLLVDRVDRSAQSQMVASAVLLAAGAKVEIPDPEDLRVKFDKALNAEPKWIDSDQRVLMEALGVGGYGDRR
jgi:hypothetical protein